jgi:N-acetylglutamate synthase-like GNAT family acetyltransferase
MENVRFREAKPSDAERILEIKQAAIGSIDTGEYTPEQLDAWQPADDALPVFRRAIESERFIVLVAEKDENTCAAYGGLSGRTNRIDAVYVHPAHMDEGIASSLVRQFETRAQMRGMADLKVVSSLNAQSFYASLGYEAVGTETRSIDGTDVEFAIMHKSLELDDR